MLEHHAGRGAEGGELAVGAVAPPGAEAHFTLADADLPAIGIFEQVDAAQEGRFAGAGRPDDRDDGAALDPERDPFQHVDWTEGFPQIVDLDHRPEVVGGGHAFAS